MTRRLGSLRRSQPRDCGVRPALQSRLPSLLDVAQGMGLPASEKVWFARGTTRKSRWCEVEHRAIDWVLHCDRWCALRTLQVHTSALRNGKMNGHKSVLVI